MYTENGLVVDLDEITEIVATADVFAAAFRFFPERLLIDTRFDPDDPQGPCGMPMVAIVDPVATLQERYFWLGQQRPALGLPRQFKFFFWPKSIRSLEESGVWAAIRDRVVRDGFAGAAETCEAALSDLLDREYAVNLDAIRGDRFQTLWETTAG